MQQSKKGYRFFANTAKISVHPKDMHPNGPLLCTLVSSTAFTLQDAIRYSNLLLFSNAIHIYSVYARLLTKGLSTVVLKSDRISVAETYFINPKIVDVSAIYYAKNDIIIEGLWRISQWL